MIGTLLTGAVLACGQTGAQPEVALRAAMELETVKGDLRGAIQRYAKLAEGKDRAVAATALVRMAQCHEKLGNAEARKIYERVVREYADQKEAAATARVKLGGTEMRSKGIVTRQVWTGPKVDTEGTISPDGRYLSCVDWDTGDLAVHDFVTGADRRLTNKGSWTDSDEFAEESAISRDGKLVAYSWFNGEFRYELRLANLSGDPNPRRLFDNQDVDRVAPYDWTSDGKWIAVQIQRRDRTKQIALVSTSGGSLRVLKSIDWRAGGKLSFSPDGKYLAYDLAPDDSSEQRDIFLLATDGSRNVPAVIHAANDYVIGWSPDGTRLLFSSDRTGSVGLWAVVVASGKPVGVPELIQPDIGRAQSLGLTQSGAMYFWLSSGLSDIYVASLDFKAGDVLSPPISQGFIGPKSFPAWSPDGKYLSYLARGERGRDSFVRLRSTDTGKIRDVRLNLLNASRPRWAPDSRSIDITARDHKGRQGIYRVDVETGAVSPIMLSEPGGYSYTVGWSPDAKKVYYHRTDLATTENLIVERDVASGVERELVRLKDLSPADAVSPDGRHLAFAQLDRPSQSWLMKVVAIEGGQPRELHRLRLPEKVDISGGLVWTSDSCCFVYRSDPSGELWLTSVADGKSRKLGFNLKMEVRQMQLHPDGRQIVFASGRQQPQVWVMENFLPALSAKE
jgi:Tol biopolymer transport system component